jgi:hypothetical protein
VLLKIKNMSRKSINNKRKLLRVFIQYGFHLWILLFVSNVVIFYGFRFFTRASTETTQSTETIFEETTPSPTVSETTSELTSIFSEPTDGAPLPSPTPVGPVVALSFSMPGISSVGGNIRPQNPVRDVAVSLYAPDANTADKMVKPLYTINTKATYDDNPSSPTYTRFVNSYVDLGIIQAKEYQVTLKTPQALLHLIRDPVSKSAGGSRYNFEKSRRIIILPDQMLISGDIFPVPVSDNVMDMNDYTMLTNCFGEKAYSASCISGSTADLDDNGIVDGLDYNIMFLSFQTLKQRGLPVPEIVVNPPILISTPAAVSPTKRVIQNTERSTPTSKPTAPTAVKANAGGGSMGIILIIFFLILLAGGGFVVFKFHLLGKLIKKNQQKGSSSEQQSAGEENANPAQVNSQTDDGVTPTTNPPEQSRSTVTEEVRQSSDSKSGSLPENQSQQNPGSAVENKPESPAGAVPATPPESATPSGQTTNSPPSQTATVPQAALNSSLIKPAVPTGQNAGPEVGATAPSNDQKSAGSADIIEKSGYLKKVSVDEQLNGTWVTLADDAGITRGFYKGTSVTDGFVTVKGSMRVDAEGKNYIEITELTPDEG